MLTRSRRFCRHLQDLLAGHAYSARAALRAWKVAIHDLLFPNNRLKLERLPRSWVDRDERMFHAIFQLLVDFVELEQPFRAYDERERKRFTDVEAMRRWNEATFNSPAALASSCFPDYTASERAAEAAALQRVYEANAEILFLYEWYKSRKYELGPSELDHLLAQPTCELDHLLAGQATTAETWALEESIKRQKEHELLCDSMLERVLRVRRFLWT